MGIMRRGVVLLAVAGLLTSTAGVVALSDVAGATPSDGDRAQRYVVVLDDGVDSRSVAEEHSRRHDARVSHVYEHALEGYAATMSPRAAARVAGDARVAYVESDGVATIAHHRQDHDGGPGGGDEPTTRPTQTLPSGVDRVEADRNTTAMVDGADERVDVDIAIIDTGMDEDHPDLNIVGGWNCVSFFSPGTCIEGSYEDGHGHGTHVAGTAAAIDDAYGVVGVAPGARLWAVGVLDDNGSGYWSWIIAGIDKVADNADTIEVANMSLGGTGYHQALRDAVTGAVDKGVVFTVAAGNSGTDVYGSDGVLGTSDDHAPAAYPEVATISALADSDGRPGGEGTDTGSGADDSFASFSNSSAEVTSGNPVVSPGAAIDLLMPGVDIRSTHKDGGYARMSGTSMAAPHAAGLAGLHIAEHGLSPTSAGDVASIRQALIDGGQDQASGNRLAHPSTEPDSKPEHLGWAASGPFDSSPSVSVTNPDDGSTVSGTVTVTAEAADDDAVTQVEFFVDGTSVAVDTTSPYEHSWDTTAFAEGSHTVTAEATDTAEQTGSDSVTVTVDNLADGSSGVEVVRPDGPSGYATDGGPGGGKHLSVTVELDWDGTDDAVAGASTAITLTNTTTGTSYPGTGTTGTDGTVTFKLTNAPGGCYTTGVDSVTVEGTTYEPSTPTNEYCK